MPRLENWSMVQSYDPYSPPEIQLSFLQGIVYDHDRLGDGEHVRTSVLLKVDIARGKAETYSGSKYSLGKPSIEWIKWLEENDYTEFVEDLKKLTSTFLN